MTLFPAGEVCKLPVARRAPAGSRCAPFQEAHVPLCVWHTTIFPLAAQDVGAGSELPGSAVPKESSKKNLDM